MATSAACNNTPYLCRPQTLYQTFLPPPLRQSLANTESPPPWDAQNDLLKGGA